SSVGRSRLRRGGPRSISVSVAVRRRFNYFLLRLGGHIADAFVHFRHSSVNEEAAFYHGLRQRPPDRPSPRQHGERAHPHGHTRQPIATAESILEKCHSPSLIDLAIQPMAALIVTQFGAARYQTRTTTRPLEPTPALKVSGAISSPACTAF